MDRAIRAELIAKDFVKLSERFPFLFEHSLFAKCHAIDDWVQVLETYVPSYLDPPYNMEHNMRDINHYLDDNDFWLELHSRHMTYDRLKASSKSYSEIPVEEQFVSIAKESLAMARQKLNHLLVSYELKV